MSGRGHLRVVHGSDSDRDAHERRMERARAGMRSEWAVAPGSSVRTLEGDTIHGRDDGSAVVRPEQFGPDGGRAYLIHLADRGMVLRLEEHDLRHRIAQPTGYRVGPRALLIGGDSLPPGTPVDPAALPKASLDSLIDRGLVTVDNDGPEAA